MTIILNDLPASVAGYIRDFVTIEVSKPKTGDSKVLQIGDDATFTVTLTNKGSVRLLNVKYHFPSITDPSVAKYVVPHTSIVYSYWKDFGVAAEHDQELAAMLVQPVIDQVGTLEPDGGTLDFVGTIRLLKAGKDQEINVHVHADIDQASLFPLNQRGSTVESPAFTIK